MSGATNRRRGITAERHLVTWLRTNGWPNAERTVVTGYRTATRERRDGGDITGTPGIVWSLKDHAVEKIAPWMFELQEMGNPGDTPVRLLVVKNRGHADPGSWWCWQSLVQFAELTDARQLPQFGLMRTTLASLAPVLHRAGYGSEAAR